MAFITEKDIAQENKVAVFLGQQWQCQLHRFDKFSPIDWWIGKNARTVGFLELKSRSHEFGKYETIYCSFRKWQALTAAAGGFPETRALFVFRFKDTIKWIDAWDIAGLPIIPAGRYDRGADMDIEPIIDVPIGRLMDWKNAPF